MNVDVVNIMFLISVIVGIILIIISIILSLKKDNSPQKPPQNDFLDLTLADKLQNDLLKTIDEADDTIEQLNGISKNILEEQEEKYKELLYLYQLIDEKKQELNNLYQNLNLDNQEDTSYKDLKIDDMISKFISTNPKFAQIVDLSAEGKTEVEIAKQLNIGQGEVKFILEFKKRSENNTDV